MAKPRNITLGLGTFLIISVETKHPDSGVMHGIMFRPIKSTDMRYEMVRDKDEDDTVIYFYDERQRDALIESFVLSRPEATIRVVETSVV